MEALEKLKQYIEQSNYQGYDPYDALKSPIFKLPFLRNNKHVRFGTQQLVKRLPFNIRPLLFVPKGYNPVTLGLCIQAYAYLYNAEPENEDSYFQKINFLVAELKTLIPKGFNGACWGYDFDWEARHANIPAYQPTVVATGIIANALYEAYRITGHQLLADLVKSAANFVIHDLYRTIEENTICFSYSPFDKQQVFNASMKGARLLAQAYNLTKNEEYKELAGKAVQFVIHKQRVNGSWGYSMAHKGGWSDNYHTGYILDCLEEYEKLCEDKTYAKNLEKGYSFYKQNFITKDGAPKFYHDKIYPLDCTAASQTILTTLRFGDDAIARKVANYMLAIMQKKDGSFRFRKFKTYSINTSFMRWSDVWMFAALSKLKSWSEL